MPIARQLHNAAQPSARRGASRWDKQGVFPSSRPTATEPLPTLSDAQNNSGITELVLTQHSPDAQLLLLPMLAHLSRNNERWITWITPVAIDRTILTAYGVETHKIRIVRSVDDEATRWILWEALNTGTSHTVIATPGELNDSGFTYLEEAASTGNSRALLIRYR